MPCLTRAMVWSWVLQDKLRLQTLIRHFFFEVQKEGVSPDPNAAAAKAIEKARSWLAANGRDTPLPSSA